MRGKPVKLDAQAVVLVRVVQVPGAAAVPALGLPPRRRQAVRALRRARSCAPAVSGRHRPHPAEQR